MTAPQRFPDFNSASGLSSALCTYLAGCRFEDLPFEVIRSAQRGILDWIGCALAGSDHASLEPLLTVLQRLSGRAEATVFGQAVKLGIADAAVANGYMGHVLDYDDTHLGGTILHTSSPVLAALFALSELQPTNGRDFVFAYVCGFEAGIRCGQASPNHHKGGWHLTGTLGCLAAGVAAGKLLQLDERKLLHALGIAATQAAGLQQNRGTMCKYLHAGRAASGGVLAGLLAQQGFDSGKDIIEGDRGFSRIYSDVSVPEALVNELGTRWEITRNGYKPYASAAVLHPVTDAMREVRAAALASGTSIEPKTVETIELSVCPYVMSISGVRSPESGMQAKFSVFHTAAVGLLDGDGGVAQYTDERVRDPAVLALRDKVSIAIDEKLRKDQSRATVVMAGRTYRSAVEHALGTVDNPMGDAAIQTKFLANAERIIGPNKAQRVIELVRKIEQLDDVSQLTRLCAG
ncbi:MAG: MmgE/PrpD family protein [Burkholderiales bacterium]